MVWPGNLNVGPDHLSHIDTGEEPTGFDDNLPDAHLFCIEAVAKELEEIAQFLETGQAPEGLNTKEKTNLSYEVCTLQPHQWIFVQNGVRQHS